MFSKILKWTAVPVALTSSLYMYNRWKSSSVPLTQTSKPIQTIQQVMTSYRPDDRLHLHYAVESYQNSGGQIIKEQGWELLSTYAESNGYFGAAYRNNHNRHIIIAHRGTQDLKDWMANLDLITRRLNEQEASAWESFAKKIIEQYGPSYQYSFTGHSLGGWLAHVCLWKYQDEFVKDKYPNFKDAFAVTVDDPGSKELLDALQPRVDSGYKIDIDKLDITSYLSHPNIVNTALGRVGTTYALFPEMNLSWLQNRTLSFTLKAHNVQTLLNEFSQESGLPKKCMRVIDWPRVVWGGALPSSNNSKGLLGYLAQMVKGYVKGDIERGEYLGFYNYSPSDVANPEQLPSASRFQLQHGIHYRVRNFDAQVLPLRNMPSAMRQFLEDLNAYPDRIKVIKQLTSEELEPSLSTLLQAYHLNEYEELVLNKEKTNLSAQVFRNELLKYLEAHPGLYHNKLAVLRDEYISKELKSLKTNTVPGLLADFREQSQKTHQLLNHLSFEQGTARFYKFIKPTWEEIEAIKTEHRALKNQLINLTSLKLNIATLTDIKEKTEFVELLENQEQQLKVAEQSVVLLLSYVQGNLIEADSQADTLVNTLTFAKMNDVDKQNMLNKAYNLKAKIAANQSTKKLAIEYYQTASKWLPNDILTWSNYAGLLTDMGRATKNPQLHLQSYEYYQKVYPYLEQMNPKQLPIICSGMAYGLILLSESIEQNQIDRLKAKLPTVKELQLQAQNLLKQAIELQPNYLNARLFQAILFFDEGNYNNALQEINNALVLKPLHPTALMRKGLILEKLGQPKEALELLEQAKEVLIKIQKNEENADWIKEIDEKIDVIKAQQPRGVPRNK